MIPKTSPKPTNPQLVVETMSSATNPPCLQWLSRAQLTLGLMCLILQLVTTTLHGAAIIQISVPLLFVASGVVATTANWSTTPPPYVALTTSVMSGVATMVALANLVAPVIGLKNSAVFIRGSGNSVPMQEVLYVMYVFMCLSEGVLSLLVTVLAYRLSTSSEVPRDNFVAKQEKIILEDNVFQLPNNLPEGQKVHHYETLNPNVNRFSEC